VTANVVAPGFVRTGLNRNAHGAQVAFINMFAKLFAVSPQKGADTPLWAAVDPSLREVTGKYFVVRKEKDGGFSDTAAIADLERRCDEMISAAAGTR
jgi:NAD(P)-dependent dehydrogenase (short-subunit alcohol dehydrogenase family)